MSAAPGHASPTLLFIPDISGFTRFVHDTDLTHSQHIIEELLEVLIDANEIGLTVSEIEGDAVLFYREGPAPTAAELLAQVQRMYVAFHAHLRRYDTHRICQCGACSTASGLTLKFVAHYGEVSLNQVKSHTKLFGRDVIVAHRLLKNRVPIEEYALLTHDLVNACATWVDLEQASWAPPEGGEDVFDFGSVKYCHIALEPLKAHVPEPTIADYGLPGTTLEVAADEFVIEAPLEMVFDVISDPSSRHLWMVELKDSDRVSHAIPQHGTSHRCVIRNSEGDPVPVSHGFKAEDDLITFTETERRQGWAKVYRLRRLGPRNTRLEEYLLIRRFPLAGTVFKLFFARTYTRQSEASRRALNEYCKTLVREGRHHPSRIVLKS